MFWWLLGAAAFLIVFYFYVNREKQNTNSETKNEQKLERFILSDSFKGSKPGYVFKNDELGLGYYLDKN